MLLLRWSNDIRRHGNLDEWNLSATAGQNEKLTATVKDIEPTTMLGIMNLGRLLGIHIAKPVLSATFGAGNTGEDCCRQNNALWGINRVISRTFEYWRGGIMSLYGLVGRLQAEISNLREEVCKWRAENCRLREEKLKAKEEHKAKEERLI
jgi:hypothetical protein